MRDLILGRGRADIDLVVEGDPAALAAALGAEPLASHSRFGTMKVDWNGEEIDLAGARRESYVRPGALPTVDLGAPIRTDLARRDFTVNAMAIPLAGPADLLDPYDGQADLRAGLLRVIHDRSFVDDPTRAIRAPGPISKLNVGLTLLVRREEIAAEAWASVDAERPAVVRRPLLERVEVGIAWLAGADREVIGLVAVAERRRFVALGVTQLLTTTLAVRYALGLGSARGTGEPGAGCWDSACFRSQSPFRNQFDLIGKRYAVTQRY